MANKNSFDVTKEHTRSLFSPSLPPMEKQEIPFSATLN
jgi:hypothetical protein